MATIYCFSSTGNSLYVAKCIAENMNGLVLPMNSNIESCEDEIIGFIFPAYFWGLPYQVEKFVSELSITSKKAYIFAVVTYGGIIGGVLGAIEKLLVAKGLQLNYGRKIKSVENYIANFNVNNTPAMKEKVERQLEDILAGIENKKENKVGAYTILNRLIYSFFPAKKADCDEFFTISDKCIGCGICQKVCPVQNISIEGKKPQFQHHCEHCLGCIHACPQVAIEWKKGTINKKRYLNEHITLKELMTFNNRS